MIGIGMILLIFGYLYGAFKFCEFVYDKTKKILFVVLSILFFILLPTLDSIVGNIYFDYLCKTEAGLKIYKTVEVDGYINNHTIYKESIKDYKDKGFKYIEGINTGLIKIGSNLNYQYLNLEENNATIQLRKEPVSEYMFIYNEKSKPTIFLPIVKNKAIVKNIKTNEVLGEDVGFSYFGSWIGIILNSLVSGVNNPVEKLTNDPYKLLEKTLKNNNNKENKNGK